MHFKQVLGITLLFFLVDLVQPQIIMSQWMGGGMTKKENLHVET